MAQPPIYMTPQPFSPPPTQGKSAAKAALINAAIFGGAICLINLLYIYLFDNGTITAFYGFDAILYQKLPSFFAFTIAVWVASLPIYLLFDVAALVGGILAARQTGKLSAGLLTGLFSGLLFFLIDVFIGNLLMTVLIIFPQFGHDTAYAMQNLTQTMVYALFSDLLLIGFGVLCGLIGGAIGRGKQPQPTAPSYTPGFPQPAYPAYPAPPSYAPVAQPGQPPFPQQ